MSNFKYIDLCSGLGGFHMAMENIKEINSSCILAADIDKRCRQVYALNHGLEPIEDLKHVKYEGEDCIEDFDGLMAGFPCFVAGTKVLTNSGYKNIEDVSLKDKLLTHTGKFQNILNLQRKTYTNNDLYNFKVKFIPEEINCTEEHPFYVREKVKDDSGEYTYNEPEWKTASKITKMDYFGMKINEKSIIPEFTFEKKINKFKTKKVVVKVDDKDMWFMMGFFIGDGWREDSRKKDGRLMHKIRFVINEKDEKEVLNRIQNVLPITFKDKGSKCNRFGCANFEWYNILKDFGKYAHGKLIPEWVQDAPNEFLEEFIKGYIKADGCFTNNHYSITTVSPNLAYGIQRILLKLGHIASVRFFKRPPTCVIEGRTVNQRSTYTVAYYPVRKRKSYAFIEKGYVWYPLDKMSKKLIESEKVYNFEVEEDNSYVVQGVISHNCQSYSLSGKRLGLDDARGTVIYDILKIVEAKKPKLICLENVKGLKSCKNKDQNGAEVMAYKLIYSEFTRLGYVITDRVISPTDINIPQKRERVIIICLRKDCLNQEIKDNEEFSKLFEPVITSKINERKEDNQGYVVFDEEEEVPEDCKLSEKELNCLSVWEDFVSMEEWDDISNEELLSLYEEETGKRYNTNFKQSHFFFDFLEYKESRIIPEDLLYETKKNKEISISFKKNADMWNILYKNIKVKEMIDKFLGKWKDVMKEMPNNWRNLEYSGGVSYGKKCQLSPFYAQLRMSGFRIRKGEVFPTLVKSGPVPIIISKKRYLTLREGARLQSLKQDFEFINKSSGWRQLGNAVNVEVIELMIRSGFEFLRL